MCLGGCVKTANAHVVNDHFAVFGGRESDSEILTFWFKAGGSNTTLGKPRSKSTARLHRSGNEWM